MQGRTYIQALIIATLIATSIGVNAGEKSAAKCDKDESPCREDSRYGNNTSQETLKKQMNERNSLTDRHQGPVPDVHKAKTSDKLGVLIPEGWSWLNVAELMPVHLFTLTERIKFF